MRAKTGPSASVTYGATRSRSRSVRSTLVKFSPFVAVPKGTVARHPRGVSPGRSIAVARRRRPGRRPGERPPAPAPSSPRRRRRSAGPPRAGRLAAVRVRRRRRPQRLPGLPRRPRHRRGSPGRGRDDRRRRVRVAPHPRRALALDLPGPPVTGAPRRLPGPGPRHGGPRHPRRARRRPGSERARAPAPTIRPVSPFAPAPTTPAGAVTGRRRRARSGRRPARRAPGLRQNGDLVPIESIPRCATQIRAAVDARHRGRRARGQRRHRHRRRRDRLAPGPNAPGHSGALMVGAGGSAFDARRLAGAPTAGSEGSNSGRPGRRAGRRRGGRDLRLRGGPRRLGRPVLHLVLRRHLQRERHRAGAVAALQSGAISITGSPLTPAPCDPARRDRPAAGRAGGGPSARAPRSTPRSPFEHPGAAPPVDDAARSRPPRPSRAPGPAPVPAVPAVVATVPPPGGDGRLGGLPAAAPGPWSSA